MTYGTWDLLWFFFNIGVFGLSLFALIFFFRNKQDSAIFMLFGFIGISGSLMGFFIGLEGGKPDAFYLAFGIVPLSLVVTAFTLAHSFDVLREQTRKDARKREEKLSAEIEDLKKRITSAEGSIDWLKEENQRVEDLATSQTRLAV